MLRSTWTSMIAAGLLLGFSTGCTTMPKTVVRGQSPEKAKLLVHEQSEEQKAEIVQTGRAKWTGELRTKGELRGLIHHNVHGTEVSHHGYRTDLPSCPDGSCQPGAGNPYAQNPYWRWGNFDAQPCPNGSCYGSGFGNCPPYHQEQCWDHGGYRHRGQYHYHTYSYKKPKNLVYPQPNQPGGVVTYPYYTHKGPSDFFWKGD